jgi:hypothetical protein
MLDKIEVLVDAIGKLNGMANPISDAYNLRNPLLIRSFARPGKHETDESGRRVFTSLLSGYKAGLFDMALKIEGKSRAGLKPTDTLTNLLGVYGIKEAFGINAVVSFLRQALKDKDLSKDTLLSYFLEK